MRPASVFFDIQLSNSRKMLADLAVNDAEGFKALAEVAKAAIA